MSRSILLSFYILPLEGDYCNLFIFTAVPDFGLTPFLPPLPKTDREDLQPS